jgi:hypothetical protein
MSKEEDKIKHSKRLHRDESTIKKQVKIAKTHGVSVENAHGFVKQHAMDCGVPNCPMCSSPRHNKATKDKLTAQEKRLFQDIDKPHHGLKDE